MVTDIDSDEVPTVRSMTPEELARRMSAGDAPRVIDVREKHEWAIASIDGAEHLPLSRIREWWRTLDPEQELVFHCHHGQRSAAVCHALAAEGFHHVINLDGGIEAWRQTVDPEMRAY